MMVRRRPVDAVWQVIAIGRANLELTAVGLALGGNSRAGLEDTLYLRKGELSDGSVPLFARARKIAESRPGNSGRGAGRPPAARGRGQRPMTDVCAMAYARGGEVHELRRPVPEPAEGGVLPMEVEYGDTGGMILK
ncbi:hypothetical protein GCM10009836_25210 [Pseudonocardia ailaonensis]|uniref:Uncharacterized protein n=1 Tax=Pseudonocardia ailaonensis TaxID=367279 RepID=A0ABN2MYR7_9PSEU